DVRGRLRSPRQTGRSGFGVMHLGRGGARRRRPTDIHSANDGQAHRRCRRVVGPDAGSGTVTLRRDRTIAGKWKLDMNVHLVDKTYELFRHYFAVPPGLDLNGLEIAAVRGVLASK